MQEGTLTLLLEMAERGRAEGAAAGCSATELEQIAAHIDRELASGHSVNDWARGLAEGLRRRARLQQPRDLAGRIREALQRIMPAPHATHDGTAWEGVAVKPDGTGLRLGLTWSRDESAQRRDAAIDYMVNELETIVRECAPTEDR
jgi:hypothetical protein